MVSCLPLSEGLYVVPNSMDLYDLGGEAGGGRHSAGHLSPGSGEAQSCRENGHSLPVPRAAGSFGEGTPGVCQPEGSEERGVWECPLPFSVVVCMPKGHHQNITVVWKGNPLNHCQNSLPSIS